MNEFLEQLPPLFTFSMEEIVVLLLFVLILSVQIFFYLFYYKRPFNIANERKNNMGEISNGGSKPKVSVVIVTENESENLSQNLPLYFSQDYSNYEVVVVDSASTDNSSYILDEMKLKYPLLYITYLPLSCDKYFSKKKLAYTLAAKAAKGDILLFTEPYCKPVSEKWISAMVDEFADNKDIVLGYSFYAEEKKIYNIIARFDNLFFSMKYLSKALKGKPYTGVYTNVAFKKHLFFDNKGFASFLNKENAEDLFLNKIMNSENTAVALNSDSFVETSISDYTLWRQIKRNYFMVKKNFNGIITAVFSIETMLRYLYYLLFGILLAYSIVEQRWGLTVIISVLFLINTIIKTKTINKISQYFNGGKFLFSLPFLELIQPLYISIFKFSKTVRRKY